MKLRSVEGKKYSFYCPGCDDSHVVPTSEGQWTFNGDASKPTFQPSILVRSGCKAPGYKPGEYCWCSYNAEEIAKGQPPSGFECGTCHLYVTDGKLQFLDDCSHKLRGQTVPMEDVLE